jgi:hypothetical protein
MKTLLFSVALIFPAVTIAQGFPRASQHAEVEQTIGLTEVEVEYYRPNVRGRQVFGEVVTMNEVWRTGANQATTIEFSLPLKFGGVEVDSGTYALFTIPSEKEWTIILNKNYGQWGSDDYNQSDDVLRVTSPVKTLTEPVESFTISFRNALGNKAELVLSWDKTEVAVIIETEMDKHMDNLITTMLADIANKPVQVYTNAARYYLQDKNMTKAASFIEKALKQDNSFWLAWWVQAQIHQEQGDTKKAVAAANKAIEAGEKSSAPEPFKYTDRLKETIAEWEKAGK